MHNPINNYLADYESMLGESLDGVEASTNKEFENDPELKQL
jgi:hypothetical protein